MATTTTAANQETNVFIPLILKLHIKNAECPEDEMHGWRANDNADKLVQ